MKLTLVIFALAYVYCASLKNSNAPQQEISYPSDKQAADTPTVFAEGIISNKGTREGSISFSPDGREIFFVKVDTGNRLRIMYMKLENDQWTTPALWEQSDVANNAEAFISYDGNSAYFISNRHAPADKGSGRIYHSQRTGNSWSSPQMIDLKLTTDKGLWFPTVSSGKTLYFGAYLDSIGNYGKSDIYMYDLAAGGAVRNAGSIINSPFEEWDPFISRDGSYMLFESDRPGGYGGVDIYISLKKDGAWTTPINLGPRINSKGFEVAAKVSPDGKYLFFDRPRRDEQDIYWVKATVIDSIRKAD